MKEDILNPIRRIKKFYLFLMATLLFYLSIAYVGSEKNPDLAIEKLKLFQKYDRSKYASTLIAKALFVSIPEIKSKLKEKNITFSSDFLTPEYLVVENPDSKTSVSEWLTYLNSSPFHEIRFSYTPKLDKLLDNFKERKGAARSVPKNAVVTKILFESPGNNLLDINIYTQQSNPKQIIYIPINKSQIQLNIQINYKYFDSDINTELESYLEDQEDWDLSPLNASPAIDYFLASLDDPFEISPIRRIQNSQQDLIDMRDAVSPFLFLIGKDNIDDALKYLEQSRRSGGKSIALLGFDFDPEVITKLYPIILIGIVFLLRMSVGHLYLSTRSLPYFHNDSWFGFYKDKMTEVVLFFTILILPGIANLICLLNMSSYFFTDAFPLAFIGVVLLFLSSAIIFDTYSLIMRIKYRYLNSKIHFPLLDTERIELEGWLAFWFWIITIIFSLIVILKIWFYFHP